MTGHYETFEAWMAAVDRAVEAKVGLSASDLADIAYRDLYDSEVSPTEAAAEALAGEGWYE